MSDKLENMMNSSIEKIKEMVNADTIIGKAITTPDGTTIIPVSKISYGYASGGSDFATSKLPEKDMFGGGNGIGVSMVPLAFLVISEGDVKLLQIQSFDGAIDRIIGMTPSIIDKISSMIKKKKDKDKKENKKENKSKEKDDEEDDDD